MDDWQRMHFTEDSIGSTDGQLVDKVVSHLRSARSAMTQAAATGNLGIARIYETELRTRANQTGDASHIDALSERLASELGTPRGQRK